MESQVKYAKISFKSLILVAPQKVFFFLLLLLKNIQSNKEKKKTGQDTK